MLKICSMLYLSGIIISFFLAFVLFAKKNKSHADYLLLAWLIVLGVHLVTFYYMLTDRYLQSPWILGIGFPLPLVHGPFLYLYTYQQTSRKPFNPKQLLHFLPWLFAYLLFARFYVMTGAEKLEVFRQEGRGFEVQSMIQLYAIYLSGVVYIALSLKRLLNYRSKMVQHFSNTERINFNWLLYLIIWMAIIWIVVLFVQQDKLIFGAASLFVLWIGYFGIRQVQVFSPRAVHVQDQHMQTAVVDVKDTELIPVIQTVPVKYQKSTLTEEEASAIHAQLKVLMAGQQPFKDPDLTLDELANQLGVHPNYLSQVINSRENKTFYDLINEQRVNAFIRNITLPSSQQYTMLAIALDCGFNSKASFNRNFKKYTGLTPSEFLKVQDSTN